MSTAREQGYEAHRKHLKRTENPYMIQAQYWDQGWVKRQKEQLALSDREEDGKRIQGFVAFLRSHLP